MADLNSRIANAITARASELAGVRTVAEAATDGTWRWIFPGRKVKQALVASTPRSPVGETVLLCHAGDAWPSTADARHIMVNGPNHVLLRLHQAEAALYALAAVAYRHQTPCLACNPDAPLNTDRACPDLQAVAEALDVCSK